MRRIARPMADVADRSRSRLRSVMIPPIHGSCRHMRAPQKAKSVVLKIFRLNDLRVVSR